VGVDYISKWVEVIPCMKVDAKAVVTFLKKNIFSRFGTPRVLISDGDYIFATPSSRKSWNIMG
jgi:hypothetical protein